MRSLVSRSSKPLQSLFSISCSTGIRGHCMKKYSSTTETPFQQLLTRCYDGNEKKVFEMIQNDPNLWNTLFELQTPTSMQSTFIGGASKNDSTPTKNETNNIFTSPFLLAIQNGHVNLIQQIINQKLKQQGNYLLKQISDPYHYNLFHILVVGNSQLAPYTPIVEPNETGASHRLISWIQITKLFLENFASASKENSQIICDLLCQTDENGYTPLMLATKFGQTQFILMIIKFMLQFDTQNQTRFLHKMLSAQGKLKQETCLHLAAVSEREDIIMGLIAAGADWNALDSDNLSPIDVLAKLKNETIQQIVSLLKQKKLDQSLFQRVWFWQQNLQEKDAFGNSVLHTACMLGNVQTVNTILSQNIVNANEKNELGFTPLWSLFLNAQLDFPERDQILQLLVEKGHADVNTCYMNELVPLSYANFMPLSTVKLLFEYKANPNWKSPTDGHTPMHTLLSNDMLNLTVVELFLQHGADLNAKSNDGISPFLIAVVKNHQVLIERLLQNHLEKIDFTAKHEPSGTDALLTAANNGNFELVKWFVEKIPSLDLNRVGANRMNVLFYAIHFANEQMIAFLVQHGAKIRGVEGTVTTPLAIAVMTQNPTIVDMLIKAGADVDEKDSYGLTALEYVNNLMQQSKQTGALQQIASLLQSKSQPKRE